MRTVLLMLAGFIAGGCGIMSQPMVARLEPEMQREVDAAWSRILTPPDRLTREQLLDVIFSGELHHFGVDRLTLRSEKAYSGGTVVLEVHFDRHRPEHDRFEVFVYDAQWMLLRHERYSRDEIDSTREGLFYPEAGASNERQRFVSEMLPWLKSVEISDSDGE